jgi:glycosyltransferase involved in cell wall biosynthesis
MIKVVEYLAARRPIVAFDLLETRRTAEAAALYAPCGDIDGFARAVASLAREPELRAAHITRAAARAESLVWEQSVPVLLEVYETL